ncbi:MAG TPA: hypothetical protein PLB53_05850, partial [Candidatus Atribacteria bacterium]|nr:hypothetical protein [Candidatus Atribacteria bacterium]
IKYYFFHSILLYRRYNILQKHDYIKGALPPRNPRKKQKHGCLIKDFRHDEKGMSPLNVFIAPCSSPRQSLSRGPQYLKAYGCLIKDFRHDEKGMSFLNTSIIPFVRHP